MINIRPSNIGLMHFGGGALWYIKPEVIKKIARNSIFAIDSDKENADQNLDGKKQNFVDSCMENNIKCWVTARKEIENYIPLEIL